MLLVLSNLYIVYCKVWCTVCLMCDIKFSFPHDSLYSVYFLPRHCLVLSSVGIQRVWWRTGSSQIWWAPPSHSSSALRVDHTPSRYAGRRDMVLFKIKAPAVNAGMMRQVMLLITRPCCGILKISTIPGLVK